MRSSSSTSALAALSLASVLPFLPSARAAYSLQTQYAGETFFDRWSFWGNRDNLTNGATYYVTEEESKDLAYTNSAGNVIIKVDNTSDVSYGRLRDSVRITTQDTFGMGSLFVLDALHTPYGCSLWPAFWTHGVSWPSGGEIDIFEGVNLQDVNQVALHTVLGCEAEQTLEVTPNGVLRSTNCDYTVNANQGCTFTDTRNVSYGADFAANGGGVFVAELASDSISAWFFPRAQIPADLRDPSASPDPSSWGAPTAYYPQSSCNVNSFFGQQQLIINIALCGDWAGQPGVFNPTCPGVCTDMVQDPRNYDNAYFEIASVRVYNGGLDTRSRAAASSIIGSIGGGEGGARSSGVRIVETTGFGFVALALSLVYLYSV
ncbi:glycoside hydrolase family 16 protein [Sporobolomyces salmoneus]|uniref:glycoside hydrolase family 16 protein n=1 Tax=Sporobolomyces salmoneus TaxID=183962 RepID=UPI00316E566C